MLREHLTSTESDPWFKSRFADDFRRLPDRSQNVVVSLTCQRR